MNRHMYVPPGTAPEDFKTLQSAAANDEGSRTAVRQLLARRSDLVEACGTTAAALEQTLIEKAGCQQVLAHEALRAELEQMRASLRLPHDGVLEELLISQIVLCWLGLVTAERRREERWADGGSYESLDFWDRHVSRLRADYLRAIRSLASVRRILVPVIQVNIADQQVNQVHASPAR